MSDETLLGNLDHLKLDSEALLKACQVLDAIHYFLVQSSDLYSVDVTYTYYVSIFRPPYLPGQGFPNVTYQLRSSRVALTL